MKIINDFYKQLSSSEKEELATKSGTTKIYLCHVFNRHRTASPLLAKRLEIASNGKVLAADLRPDIFGEEAA